MLPTDYYEFMNPVRIISGYKAVDNLPYELTQLGVSRPLLIQVSRMWHSASAGSQCTADWPAMPIS